MKIEIRFYKHDADGQECKIASRKAGTFSHAKEIIEEVKEAYKKHLL